MLNVYFLIRSSTFTERLDNIAIDSHWKQSIPPIEWTAVRHRRAATLDSSVPFISPLKLRPLKFTTCPAISTFLERSWTVPWTTPQLSPQFRPGNTLNCRFVCIGTVTRNTTIVCNLPQLSDECEQKSSDVAAYNFSRWLSDLSVDSHRRRDSKGEREEFMVQQEPSLSLLSLWIRNK